ncbi:hypothetical protein ACFE04_010233 [Oxalis oulophora]
MITNNTPSSKPRLKWKFSFHRSPPPPPPPNEFLCPISGTLMNEPVIVTSGHTFELAIVLACKTLSFTPILADGTSPDFSKVINNFALKSAIVNWCKTLSLNPPKPLNFFSAEKIVHTMLMTQKPNVKLSHAESDIARRKTHFHTSSNESITSSVSSSISPLQLRTQPSCQYSSFSSSSSSSEIECVSQEQEFVSKLRSSQVFEIENAVFSLRKLTRNREETRISLCTPDLLSALKSLLVSRYIAVQVNSVAALVNLSLEKSNKVMIVRSGIVPPLIDVLKSGSPEGQEHAAGAIFSLAVEDVNKTAIGVLGAIEPLYHLLRSESEPTRNESALALYHLTLVQCNKSKLIKLGSIPGLLNMVKSGHIPGRILLVLGNLASCIDGRAVLLDKGGVECMVSVLKVNELNETTREGCVAVLFALSQSLSRFRVLALEAGAREVLRKVIDSGRSDRAKSKARKILERIKE